jgi:peptidoglycan/LPS O-acetylase OafA/YrhL
MSAGEHAMTDPGKEARRAAGLPVVPAFDGYRAFAILGVVVIHMLLSSGVSDAAGDSALGVFIWGTFGQAVDTLFIVSGFVVFLPTAARGTFGSVRGFAIRRIARIVPAYWLAIALLLVVMAISTPTGLAYPSSSSIGFHLAFLQTPVYLVQGLNGQPDGLGFGIDNPLWTLSVEMGFYLVLPFVAAAYLRRPLLGLAICAAIAIGWRELFANLDSVVGLFGGSVDPAHQLQDRFGSDDQLPFWAFSFGCGMTGAWAFVRLRERVEPTPLRAWAGRAQLASVAVVALFIYLAGRYVHSAAPPFTATVARQSLLIGLGYTAATTLFMVSTALVATRRQWPFSAPRVRRLGDISYGIYLSHFAIAVYVGQILAPVHDGSVGSFLLWTALVLPAASVYGYLSARYVEIPIRQWARRFGRGGAASASRAS